MLDLDRELVTSTWTMFGVVEANLCLVIVLLMQLEYITVATVKMLEWNAKVI